MLTMHITMICIQFACIISILYNQHIWRLSTLLVNDIYAKLPLIAAQDRAECPCEFLILASAPCSSSTFKHSALPVAAAQIMAELESDPIRLGLACPSSNNTRNTSA